MEGTFDSYGIIAAYQQSVQLLVIPFTEKSNKGETYVQRNAIEEPILVGGRNR